MSLPEPDPIAANRRRTRRRQLIPEEAACVLCGETDPDMLEDDHVLGVAASDSVRIWLCANHHRKQTAMRRDHQAGSPPGRCTEPVNLPERLLRAIRALGVFVYELAHAVFGFANGLAAFARGLDAFAPGWRDQPWAI